MMKHRSDITLSQITPVQDIPCFETPDWAALYERICLAAMRRSSGLLLIDEEASLDFDRGARALRALMGAAEIARRMKTEDKKEQDLDDGEEKPAMLSDEELTELYWSLKAKIDAVEQQEETADQRDNPEGGAGEDRRTGGENVEGPCP